MKIKPDKVFLRRAKKLLKGNPNLRDAYDNLYIKLANNPFDPSLHTHVLSGNLKGKHACSLTYDLSVIFISIHLLDVGTHDEVY